MQKMCVHVLSNLIGHGSGIPFYVESQMCNLPMINIEREDVTRIYYGKELSIEKGISWRCTYGLGGEKGSTFCDTSAYEVI